MKIELNNIRDGEYKLIGNNLYFYCNKNDILKIDKKSALEITRTLMDNLNMLDEDLIIEMEEKIDV